MKMTLLDMVQDILNDMDSDEVNSINDTLEAMQVARIIRTTYYDLINERDWPHLHRLVNLEGMGDPTHPNYIKIPSNVGYVEWLTYDNIDPSSGSDRHKQTPITFQDTKTFLMNLAGRDSTADNVTMVYDDTAGPLLIFNDRMPEYYTVIDDVHIICDAWDSSVDTTLQQSKIMAEGLVDPEFTMDDNFIPDLPSKNFSFLLSEAKSVSFNAVNQAANPKEEARSRRHRIWSARNKRSQNKSALSQYPDYGRKGRQLQKSFKGSDGS